MRNEAMPLMERHRIFHTKDVEELRSFLHTKGFHLQIPPRSGRELDVRYNGLWLPGIFVGYFHYAKPTAVLIRPDRDDYWLHLPIRGSAEVTSGRDTVRSSSRRAAIASPTRDDYYQVKSAADSDGIRLVVTKAFLVEQLTALLGRPMDAPLEFAQSLDLTSGYGRSLASYLLLAAADLNQPDSMLLNPFTISDFEQFIVNGLLMAHPHNYGDALRRIERPVAPRDVKRAVDFVQAHLSLPITVADIARAADVPGRTLFKHFKDCHGVSPMRYVRNARLEHVREALSRADRDTSVTEVASRWGFTHLGRFSAEYRKRFGESPSETMKRRRARHRQ